MESVTSRQNAIVKTFRKLAARRARGETHLLLDGEHLVREAADAGLTLTMVAVASRLLARSPDPGPSTRSHESAGSLRASHGIPDLVARLQRQGTRLLAVSESVMSAISPVRTPSGIIAIATYEPPRLEGVMNGKVPLVVLLAGIQDPGNLGAAARTAEASGATGLVACSPSADPFGWKALRGAMGSTLRLPVPERVPLNEAVQVARRKGLAITAAVPRGGTPLFELDWRRPIAVLLGGEGAGLTEGDLEHADERVSIPMKPPVESLNVAVSAGVLLYEAARQRGSMSASS